MPNAERIIDQTRHADYLELNSDSLTYRDKIIAAHKESADKIKDAVNHFGAKYKGLLPDNVYVGVDKPQGGVASLSNNWSVLSYRPGYQEMHRFYFRQEPKFEFNPETFGYEVTAERGKIISPGYITLAPVSQDAWNAHGWRALQEMSRIVSDRQINS